MNWGQGGVSGMPKPQSWLHKAHKWQTELGDKGERDSLWIEPELVGSDAIFRSIVEPLNWSVRSPPGVQELLGHIEHPHHNHVEVETRTQNI